MNLMLSSILLIAGLLVLWKSADLLVAGAVRLAERLRVRPLVIGLTVVAMGTSAPELAAGIAAVLRNAGDIALGNVYGSNIANLALIGSLAALIRPTKVRKQTLQYQIPVMLATALLLWPIISNLHLSRIEAFLLLAVFVTLLALVVGRARTEAARSGNKIGESFSTGAALTKTILLCAAGLAGLALGAEMTVRSAVFLGEAVGLSKAVIGLTIIAVGTSLPELATSLVAAVRGHHDISVGNLVGSNIFNTLLVTGTAGMVRPFDLASRLAGPDYWIMIAVSAAFALAAIAGRRTIKRPVAALLLCGYLAYIIYLFADGG